MADQNPFDGLSDKVWAVVETNMGYDGSWTPADLSGEQTARVLFGEPTKEEKLGEYGDSYDPRTFFMEYWDGDFVGLFESVRATTEEYVTINDKRYYVQDVKAKYDGRNYRAKLQYSPL